MLNMKNITEVSGVKVFTVDGDFFGEVEDAILTGNKVSGWRVKTTSDSSLRRSLPSAKGVQVPHQLVRAIGEIMLIENATANFSSVTEE